MLKEGIFIEPQIREIIHNYHFVNLLTEIEKPVWLAFREVCSGKYDSLLKHVSIYDAIVYIFEILLFALPFGLFPI